MIDLFPNVIFSEVLLTLSNTLTLGLVRPPPPSGTLPSAWQVFYGLMPKEPPNAICIFNTPGIVWGKLQRSGEVIEEFAIQILFRSASYGEMQRMAGKTIVPTVDAAYNVDVTINHVAYRLVVARRMSHIIDLPEEPDQGRRRCAVNYLLGLRMP